MLGINAFPHTHPPSSLVTRSIKGKGVRVLMSMMWETNYVDNFPSTHSLQFLSRSPWSCLCVCGWFLCSLLLKLRSEKGHQGERESFVGLQGDSGEIIVFVYEISFGRTLCSSAPHVV